MTFAKIISESGINSNNYPKASEIAVSVVDLEGQILEESELNFASPIFSGNSDSLESFKKFLDKCETGYTPKFLYINLLEYAIIVRDDSTMDIQVFRR